MTAILVSITSERWSASFRLDDEPEAPPFLGGVPGRCFGFATGLPPEPDPRAGGWLGDDPPLAGWRHGPRDVAVAVEPAGEGVAALTVTSAPAGEPVVAVGARFVAAPGERFWGFGERSHALDLRGTTVEHRVGEGPYQLDEYGLVEAITPAWAVRRRRDATYTRSRGCSPVAASACRAGPPGRCCRRRWRSCRCWSGRALASRCCPRTCSR